MKHVILYGPPAVGKLTVATELAKLTGYGLLHNHLTNDLVHQVFPYGHPEMARLVIRFRSELIETAAKAHVDGLISTLVYARNGTDDKVLGEWRRAVAKHGGETCFVRLHCPEPDLKKRMAVSSRSKERKIFNAAMLRAFMKPWDLFSPVRGVASLELDTSALKPAAAAKLVAQHFRLPLKPATRVKKAR